MRRRARAIWAICAASLLMAACASSGRDGENCSVEQTASTVTIRCGDDSEASFRLAGADAGMPPTCQVSREADEIEIACPGSDPVRFTPGGADAGTVGSCSVTDLADGAVVIDCPDGTSATIPVAVEQALAGAVGAAQAACRGCHDAPSDKAHFEVMTSQIAGEAAESCATCHSERGLRPVSEAHARPPSDLNVRILSAAVDASTRAVRVVLELTDGAGAALSPDDISFRFLLARVGTETTAVGGLQVAGAYENYLLRAVSQVDAPGYPLEGEPRVTQQPTTESGSEGTFEPLGGAEHAYVFRFKLEDGYAAGDTHLIALYATRSFEGETHVGGASHFFVPDESSAPVRRQIVQRDTCNQCHDSLAAHGGSRQAIELCLGCHTQGAIDPETENSLDFNVMIHRIHAGSALPSVQAGAPYGIVGYGARVHDYARGAYPRPIAHCQSCHTESDDRRWVINGTRAACSSCHDTIQDTHPVPLSGTLACGNANCHNDEGIARDAVAAHRLSLNDPGAPVFEVEILSVEADLPSARPRVRIRALTGTSATGAVLPLTSVAQLSILNVFVNGPNTGFVRDGHTLRQYDKAALEQLAAAEGQPGEFEFLLPDTLAEVASGMGDPATESFTLGLRVQYDPTPEASPDDDRVDMRQNPVATLSADHEQPVIPRLVRASTELCNRCHGDLSAHGGGILAKNLEACVLCHTSSMDTRGRMGASGQAGPATSLRLSSMIHRIHAASLADDPFVVFGYAPTPPFPQVDLSELGFPGQLGRCAGCHDGETYTLPLLGDSRSTTTAVLDADGGVTGE